MNMKLLVATGAAMVASAMPGHAQDRLNTAFTGGYAGAEIGVQEHHFDLEITVPLFNVTETNTYRSRGVAGGAFAGFDLAVAPRVRLGAEAAIGTGGTQATARLPGGVYAEDPQWNYRVGGRAGYVIGDHALVYATLGYGAHRVRVTDDFAVEGASDWSHSVTYGGGIEVRASRRIGVRLDYRELAGVNRTLMLGVPVRF
ncbi:outer membrane protein [Sphingomonas sp. Leaf4]|uniref:outer membrane protein n=1 Tax=Sphingomonas sp. Leaf4 TaxID=2876553 RepID=UPI001E44D158|nr:outer membrane beta-barrel protein [Sphingomonas sp. Leaf4]